jgi:tetratricopeptide (TPR) repeat protein
MWKHNLILMILLVATAATAQENKTALIEKHYEEGLTQQDKNLHPEAVASFGKCLYLDMRFADAYTARATSKEKLNDWQGALTDLNSYLELIPNDYEVLLRKATLLFKLHRYTEAQLHFKKLLKQPPGETNTVFYRKSAHSEGTDQIMTAQGAIKPQLYNYLGLIELQLDHCAQSISYFDSALQLSKTEADYFVNRALAKQACNDATASADFEKALSINPDHTLAKHNLAVQSATDGSFADTEKQLTAVIESDSTLYFPFVNRGYYRFMSGNYAGALSDYNQAIRLNNTDPEVWLNRGLVKEKLQNLKGAHADYTQAIALKEDLVKAWLNRGNVYMKQELYADAIEDYSAAIIYQPDYGHAYFNRAIALHKKKSGDEACIDLKRAEQLGVTVDAKIKKSICK